LERHELVGMNLHPDMEDATEYVGFDHTRLRRRWGSVSTHWRTDTHGSI
jgi:hypothetical protein